MKQDYLDFVIREDNYRKIVFRFYPKNSHMHSFGTTPPTSFNDVYKVYYAWGIMEAWRKDNGKFGLMKQIFGMSCDECSALEELEYVIRHVLRYKKKRTQALSFGQPGSMWTITFHPHKIYDDDLDQWKVDPSNGVLFFEVFDNWTNLGYQFDLEVAEALAFCTYLHNVNQHMLENGEPI